MKRGPQVSSASFPHFILSISAKRSNHCLTAKGWIKDKTCHVTIDTKAAVTTARPDITTELPKRKPSQSYVLQSVQEDPPVLK
jgi:hypothetical protein